MPDKNLKDKSSEVTSESENRVRNWLSWAKQKLSVSTTASDKTTRQSVSNPSTPRLVRAKRLVSASADNIRNIMENTFLPSRSEIQNHPLEHDSNRLEGAISDQEQQHNMDHNRFGTSPASTPMHGFHTIRGLEPEEWTQSVPQVTDQEPQNKENTVTRTHDQEVSSRKTRSGATYGLPGMGEPTLQAPRSAEQEAMDELTEEPMNLTMGANLSNQPVTVEQQLKELRTRFFGWRKCAGGVKENMHAYAQWWLNVDEIINPLLIDLENILEEATRVAPDNELCRIAAKEEDQMLFIRDRYREEAEIKRRQVAEEEASQQGGGTASTEYQYVPTAPVNLAAYDDPIQLPFTITMDHNLEGNLAATRTITNLNTQLDEANSKARLANNRFQALDARMRIIEEGSHTCDPQIYVRLSQLEEDVRYMQSVMARQIEVDTLKANVTSQRTQLDQLRNRYDQIGQMIAQMERGGNRMDENGRPGPNWGSGILGSRDGTPNQFGRMIRSSTRISPSVRFNEKETPFRPITQVDGPYDSGLAGSTNDSASSDPKDNQGKVRLTDLSSASKNRMSAGGNTGGQAPSSRLQAGLVNEQNQCREGMLGQMPADNRINLDKRQPLPTDWSGNRRKTPLYTMNQIGGANYLDSKTNHLD